MTDINISPDPEAYNVARDQSWPDCVTCGDEGEIWVLVGECDEKPIQCPDCRPVER